MKKKIIGLVIIFCISIGAYFVFNSNFEEKGTLSLSEDSYEKRSSTFESQINNFGEKKTNKTSSTYTKEDAINNGDITPTNITATQRSKINKFMENVKQKKPDFIRFVQFSSNNEAIITEFQFNGELIYYLYDSSRNKRGEHNTILEDGSRKVIMEDYCRELVPDSYMPYITDCYRYEAHEF